LCGVSISGCNINLSRRSRPRWFALVATATGAIAVVALLGQGGHGGAQQHQRAQPSVPAPLAKPASAACAPASSPGGSAGPAPVSDTRRSPLGRVLSGALRAAAGRLHGLAATAAVVVCGRVLWADATGDLDLRSKRRANDGSLFVLNSAAKTVVATMVMQEIQRGDLSLGTRLSQFYPWLPNARQITVRMLLSMTSGLPDYLDNPGIEWMMHHRPRHRWTVDQVLTGLGAGLGTPRFRPGRGFQYSDTNYIVLGAILERITHRSIERDFQQLIAKPLGITSATFVPTPAAKARVAHPYLLYRDDSLKSQWIPGFGVSTAVWGPVFTDGGLASSSLDLAWFGNALLGGRLVGAAAVREMTQIGPGDYGLGMRSKSVDGHLWLGHRGYFGGFEAEDWSDSSRQLTIAVGTNLQIVGGEPTSTGIWTAIARAYDRQTLNARS
jgi:D-alanyl-D-alanine carboxypeptidase